MSVGQRINLRRGAWSIGRALPDGAAFPATVVGRCMGCTPMDQHGNQIALEPLITLQLDAGPLVVMFERTAEALA